MLKTRALSHTLLLRERHNVLLYSQTRQNLSTRMNSSYDSFSTVKPLWMKKGSQPSLIFLVLLSGSSAFVVVSASIFAAKGRDGRDMKIAKRSSRLPALR